MASKERDYQILGLGTALQLVGLLCLFSAATLFVPYVFSPVRIPPFAAIRDWIPAPVTEILAAVIGLFLMAAGHLRSYVWRCGDCKTPLPHKDAHICAACKAPLD